MKKYKLDIIEISLIGMIGIVTVITQPPLMLLAIPFVIIAGMRGVFSRLESSGNHGITQSNQLNNTGGKK